MCAGARMRPLGLQLSMLGVFRRITPERQVAFKPAAPPICDDRRNQASPLQVLGSDSLQLRHREDQPLDRHRGQHRLLEPIVGDRGQHVVAAGGR